MNKSYSYKKYFLILIIFFNFLFCSNVYSAADIQNSIDSDIKIFGNWKVLIINLKNKKFVFMEANRDNESFFRIIIDKSGIVGYNVIQYNVFNYPNGTNQSGNILLRIGDKEFNVNADMVTHNRYVITYLNNMPKDFINMAKTNKYFIIYYGPSTMLSPPISLEGFSAALKYAEQLKSKASSF